MKSCATFTLVDLLSVYPKGNIFVPFWVTLERRWFGLKFIDVGSLFWLEWGWIIVMSFVFETFDVVNIMWNILWLMEIRQVSWDYHVVIRRWYYIFDWIDWFLLALVSLPKNILINITIVIWTWEGQLLPVWNKCQLYVNSHFEMLKD